MTAVTERSQVADGGPTGTQVPVAERPSMYSRSLYVLLIVANLVAVALPVVVATGWHSPVRLPLALVFLLLVPGVSLAVALRLPSLHVTATLAMGLSLSADLLVANFALVWHIWSPLRVVCVLAGVSLVTLPVAVWRLRAHPNPVIATPAGGELVEPERDAGVEGGGGTSTSPAVDLSPPPEPEAKRGLRAHFDVLGVTAAAVALAFYLYGVSLVDLDNVTPSLGMISALNWPMFVGLGVLVAALGWELLPKRTRDGSIAILVIVLVFAMFSLPNIADSAASLSTSYTHVGLMEYIQAHGAILDHFDARFSWPGFFSAAGILTESAGLSDPRLLLSWAPVFYELLLLLPLTLTARWVCPDRRLAWIAVVLCYGGLWSEQDYFSPQATAYVLYVVMLSVIVWFVGGERVLAARRHGRPPGWGGRLMRLHVDPPPRPNGVSSVQLLATELGLLVIASAMIVSHQLTPLALILVLTVSSALAVTRFRLLWLLVLVVFVAWFSYGAKQYWAGHAGAVFGDLGNLRGVFDSGVSQRIAGPATYRHMQYVRLGLSALYLLGGLAGAIKARHRPWTPLLAALCIAPFGILGLQSYGGEAVIRTFLYAMPFLAVLTSYLFAPLLRLRPVVTWLCVTVLLMASVLGLIAARGVNVAFERVTVDQVDAARDLDAVAPPGSLVGEAEEFGPVGVLTIGEIKLRTLTSPNGCWPDLVSCADAANVNYLYFSAGQQVFGSLRNGYPTDWLLGQGVAQLVASGHWTVLAQTPHAVVLQAVKP